MAYSQDQATPFEMASYGRDSANKTSKMFPVDSTALIAGANINVSNQVGIEAEIGISVNPLNPLNIVATSNNVADLSRMATYFSTDGGTTWTTVFIDENQDGRGVNDTRFDPNVAFDSDGNVYVVYSLNTGTTSHLMLARSTDGGNTYAQVTEVTTDPANNNLHTPMVTTRADPSGADDVLILWARVVFDENVQAALSLDGGATFPTINNNINDAAQRTFLPWAVVDDAGDFHVAWEVNLVGTSPDGRIFHDVLDGATLADGTDVTVTDIQITDNFQATSRLPAQPDRGVWSTVTIDADRSGGANDGRIYISYTDRASTATDDTNIFVRFSDDGGSNWSGAIQINDDGGTTSQFLPRLALDQTTGDVYAAWYDARNDAANNQLVDIFAAVSVNGGSSWGPNEQLTTAQSDESTNNPLRYEGNYLEYMGLAAFGGAAFVGWTDARAANFTTGNNEEIFFGRVSRAGTIADDTDNVLIGTRGNDLLRGLGGNDIILGLAGDDTLEGGDGNDFLSGGRGNDNINTGHGDDVVLGGQGNDRIGGMAGRDVVRAGAGDDFVAWNDPTGDVVFGGRGNDTILGGNVAADEIHGGAGDDLIQAFATSPKSATASDRLFGDAGDDTVIGGNAADTIEGGRGDDILTGNDGADVFIFRDNRTGDDIITDFDPSEDVVQLVGFGASFDPLAVVSATSRGTELDLGGGNSVLLLGRTVAEFSADHFLIL
ncbi:hypothetical protein ACFIOY_35295 [Bradyrhizobium sp. TZ2]